jgi:uncharacterized protein with PhoU and TrkA domain
MIEEGEEIMRFEQKTSDIAYHMKATALSAARTLFG